jgi:hypothetical protein
MPSRAGKSKITFRRMVAPECLPASELATAERILARLVALAYAGDHQDLFSAEAKEQSGLPMPSSSAVPLVAQTISVREVAQYERLTGSPTHAD